MPSPPKLLHNIAALGSVQVISYLLPLITLPYVTRVLGVEAWGKLALVQVVLGYFSMFTNWGFGWSGTRKVAGVRDDHLKLSEVFMSIWAAQWLLAVFAALVLATLILTVPFFQSYWPFYVFGLAGIFTTLLFPVWFLTGLERMKQVAAIQIGSRLVGLPLIFLFVKTSNDAPLMIGIGVATALLGGILTLIWIQKDLKLHWHLPGWQRVFAELKESGSIFASTVWISLYTTLTPTILAIVAGPVAVGYYSLADKARLLAQSALSPISQALFPRMSHLFKTDQAQARQLLHRSAKFIVLLSAGASITLWLLAEYIVILLAGEQFRPAVAVLHWLAPLPFVISLSNIFGVQVMLPNQKTVAFNRILSAVGALSLMLIYPLIEWHGAIGASINTLIAESVVTISMGVYLLKTGLLNEPTNLKKYEN